MALQAKLLQKLSQSLLMTPQLQQAIKLLQLGRLEYQEAIERELLENPALEEMRDEIPAPSQSADDTMVNEPASFNDGDVHEAGEGQIEKSANESPVAWEDYLESYSDYRGASSPRGMHDDNDKPSLEATVSKSADLFEYLFTQLRMSDMPESDRSVAFHVVGNLNRDGYLCASYEEIAESCGCSVEDVARIIEALRSCDPPGVGARNLQECLLIQLDNIGLGDGLEAKIVSQHLDKLEKRKYDQIAKTEHVNVEDVYKAVKAIQTLEPRPGRPFMDDATRYVVPDVYVYKMDGEYVITLNEDGLPKLRVSPYYLDLMKSGGDTTDNPNKAYLTERLKAASWLIKSIHQRQNTIFRVTESIVKFQREFLDHGISKLKPLVLKDVAEDIGMHESTVSRVTTNKYVHTPQGVFELKFFFTTGIRTGEGDVSSSSVKEKIRQLIAQESTDNPISDQQIVEILNKDQVDIARRTVAKYRESMGIPSSSKRKKVF